MVTFLVASSRLLRWKSHYQVNGYCLSILPREQPETRDTDYFIHVPFPTNDESVEHFEFRCRKESLIIQSRPSAVWPLPLAVLVRVSRCSNVVIGKKRELVRCRRNLHFAMAQSDAAGPPDRTVSLSIGNMAATL